MAGSRSSARARPTSRTPRARSRTTRPAVCSEGGVEYTELQVATDALTVVVNPDLAIDCLTTEQLKMIWEPGAEGKITNWNQVDPSFPDEEITLFGPGTDSGTFDYFTDAINGEEGASRTDYEASEDDNVIVQGVSGTPGCHGLLRLHLLRGELRQPQGRRGRLRSGCVARPPRRPRTAPTRRCRGRCSSTSATLPTATSPRWPSSSTSTSTTCPTSPRPRSSSR